MLRFRWFYALLFVNFLASISIIPMSLIGGKSEYFTYLIVPIYVIWFLLSLGSLIVIIIMSALHLKRAIALLKNNDKLELRIGMKRMKLASIPFFLANFLYFVLLALLLFAASRGFIIFTPIPLLFLMAIGMTYVIMVCTSIYGISYLIYQNKCGQITKGKMALQVIAQLIFVLDIIDTMILVFRNRTPEEKITKKMVIRWSVFLLLFLLSLYLLLLPAHLSF